MTTDEKLRLLIDAIGEHVMPGFYIVDDDDSIRKLASMTRREARRIAAWEPVVRAAFREFSGAGPMLKNALHSMPTEFRPRGERLHK